MSWELGFEGLEAGGEGLEVWGWRCGGVRGVVGLRVKGEGGDLFADQAEFGLEARFHARKGFLFCLETFAELDGPVG